METEKYSGASGQVFEVVVRQALAGAPWQEICAGPMREHNIKPEDVEAEVQKRRASSVDPGIRIPFIPLILVILALLIAVAIAIGTIQN